jgi:phytanoyl-CoA hydroxylase
MPPARPWPNPWRPVVPDRRETQADRFAFSEAEQDAFDHDGYVIRRDVFAPDEVAEMIELGEALVAELVRDRTGTRLKVGSYVFDPDLLKGVMIKWEGDTDAVHGIEPFAHLCEPLGRVGLDPRLVDPMVSVLGHDDIGLFTEKLNLKRPEVSGPNPPHQDYPYWRDSADDAAEVATTIVYLDDASVENGCTWVAPGSHRSGMWKTRDDFDSFGANELDSSAYPELEMVPVEVSAGSTVTFGAFLVHQSTPNRSTADRRALLYSYQPADRRTILDSLRSMA